MKRMLLRDKLGVSVMVGYVLLIVIAVVIGAITYQGMKTYLPREKVECPEDVSVFIKEISCALEGTTYTLDFTLQNTGLFDISGYYISGIDSITGDIIPLEDKMTGGDGEDVGGAITINLGTKGFEPNSEARGIFDLGTETITSITIVPVRYQEENRKLKFVSCEKASVSETITCS